MKASGPIFVIRLARPDQSTGSAYWTSKALRGKPIWGDRWDAHPYTNQALARRQWMRLVDRLEARASAGESLHLDQHPNRGELLRDPTATRTTLAATVLRLPSRIGEGNP